MSIEWQDGFGAKEVLHTTSGLSTQYKKGPRGGRSKRIYFLEDADGWGYEYYVSVTAVADYADDKSGLINWSAARAAEAATSSEYSDKVLAGDLPTTADKRKWIASAQFRDKSETQKAGTLIHRHIEDWCRTLAAEKTGGVLQNPCNGYVPQELELPAEYEETITTAKDYILKNFIPIAVELPVLHPLGVPGTIDLVAKLRAQEDGGYWIIDWKTKKTSQLGQIYNANLLQLAAYRHALEALGNKIEGVMVVQFARDSGAMYREAFRHTEDSHRAFESALTLWNYRKPLPLVQIGNGIIDDYPNGPENEEAKPWVSKVWNAWPKEPTLESPTLDPDIFFRRVDELELSIRTANCLKNDNVVYIGDLIQKTDGELLRIPNFGRKSLNEIKEVLAQLGLHLGMDVSGWGDRPGGKTNGE